jgi:phage shock protein E
MRIKTTLALALASLALALSSAAQSRSPPLIGYADLVKLLSSEPRSVLLLDVRTADEYRGGHIRGAVLAPYDALASTFSEPDKDRPIVVYCRSGRRSAIAKETLESMGYRDVSDFGGMGNWKGLVATGEK